MGAFSTVVSASRALFARDEGKERPECGSGPRASYDTGLHVFALFLILVLSTAACSFPIVVRRFPRFPVPHRFLFLSRHFGTGVLIATAFVHLLPTAFISLTDPCLAPFWNEGYPAMAGFIAMLSVLIVVGVEMFFATKGAGHVHGGDFDQPGDDEDRSGLLHGQAGMSMNGSGFGKPREGRGSRHFRTQDLAFTDEDDGDMTGVAKRESTEQGLIQQEAGFAVGEDEEEDDIRYSRDSLDDLDADPASPQQRPSHRKSNSNGYATLAVSSRVDHPSNAHNTVDTGNADAEAVAARLLLQCLLLEAGILFHSIFIGMAVSVATGPPFIVLLVAISFHQTFEGFALGSRIAAIPSFGPKSFKPWLMALAYGTTTPIGQAIGLLVHNLYDPASEAGLLIVGIMNSISSGLLLFAGLVELLAEDFLREETYVTLRGRKRIEACAAVVCGALLMAIVGAFA